MRVIRELRERPQEEERRVRTMFDEALKSQIEEIAHYKNQLLAKED